MLKKILLVVTATSLGCSICPPAPEHFKCGIHADVDPPGFYCVNSKTGQQVYRPFDDPGMKAGQAVSGDDFVKLERWGKECQQIVETRCAK